MACEKVSVKFSLGEVVATPGVHDSIPPQEIFKALQKHMSGNWGVICDDDKLSNEEALENGSRLLSAYVSEKGVKFWVITEADRSVTTLLLPSEY